MSFVRNNAIFRGYVTGSLPMSSEVMIFDGQSFEPSTIVNEGLTDVLKQSIHDRIELRITPYILNDETMGNDDPLSTTTQDSVIGYVSSSLSSIETSSFVYLDVEYIASGNVANITKLATIGSSTNVSDGDTPDDPLEPPVIPSDPRLDVLSISLNIDGGDEGLLQTYPFGFVTNQTYDISGSFNAYGNETGSSWDRLIVSTDSNVLWDTGCVTSEHTQIFTLPSSSYEITVQVIPNCNLPTTGSAWQFSLNT